MGQVLHNSATTTESPNSVGLPARGVSLPANPAVSVACP